MKHLFVLLLTVCAFPTGASAAVVYESGMLGSTGLANSDLSGNPAPTGANVTDFSFVGVRFLLSQPVLMSRIGGHFVIDPGLNDTFFGAVVQLGDLNDFPDSGDLSTSDVLGATQLTFPDLSAEVFGNLELSLVPGWYSMVFGSGLFGTAGSGAAVLNNPDIGSPSYIGHQTGVGWFNVSTLPGPFENFRLVVEGTIVPEPRTSSLLVIAIAVGCVSRRRSISRMVPLGPSS